MFHHLPCGVDTFFAVEYRVMRLAIPLVLVNKQVCTFRIKLRSRFVAKQSCTLHEEGTMVTETPIVDWYLHVVLITDVAKDGNIKVRSLRPEFYFLCGHFFFRVLNKTEEIIHNTIYRLQWGIVIVEKRFFYFIIL